MTRKHFKALAAIVKRYVDASPTKNAPSLRPLAEELADLCAAENPNFVRARFLLACGFTD